MKERQKAFWPLPGGWEKYDDSLYSTLKYVSENEPSVDELVEWFLDSFDKVNSTKNAKGYVNNVLKSIGFFNFDDNKYLKLSDAGEYYLKNKDNDYLSNVLLDYIYGFKEILISIEEGNYKLEEIRKRVSEILKNEIRWSSTYPIKYRIDWLRCLDLVKLESRKYILTSKGKHVASSIDIIKKKEKSDQQEKKVKSYDTITEKIESDKIINKLKESEHDSQNPSEYELAIAEAFEYIGYNTQHIGNAGDTDVLAHANIGSESYSIIIDGKTTKHDKVIERQISWPTVQEHKIKHAADFAIIIGPDFAGGDMIKRADKFEVLLITTEQIIELLKIQDNTPFNLLDLKEIFQEYGLLDLTKNKDFNEKILDYILKLHGLPKIFSKLHDLQKLREKTTVRDLYWALDKEYNEQEIIGLLQILRHLDMVKKDENDNYIAIINVNVAERKFRLMADLLNS